MKLYKISGRLFYLTIILMFFPNLGLARQTSLGLLKVEDYMLPISLLLGVITLLSGKFPRTVLDKNFRIWFLFLLIWASISTLTIPLRYPFESLHIFLFSLAKVTKWFLFGFVGYLAAKFSSLREFQSIRDKSIDVIGLVVSIFYIIYKDKLVVNNIFGYQASNMMSVLLGAILAYQIGYLMDFSNLGKRENFFKILIMIIEIIGSFYTQGRAGWFALAGSLAFQFRKYITRLDGLLSIVLVSLVFIVGYTKVPEFHAQIDMTLHPKKYGINYIETPYGYQTIMGLDTGGRIGLWLLEGRKVIDAPILGRGFWHRGGESGLIIIGSHNFFIQMFLELGVIGGLIILIIFFKIWSLSSSDLAHRYSAVNRIRFVWIVLVLGLMTGEYLYGGANVGLTFILFSPLISIPLLEGDKLI